MSSRLRVWALGRVIARPFLGRPGAFTRTPNRHDYAMPPRGETLLDRLTGGGDPRDRNRKDQRSVCRQGHRRGALRPRAMTMEWIMFDAQMERQDRGLIFANLVDFDTVYGHRNDVAGYAANLERFDRRLAAAAASAAARTTCWW